MILNSPYISGSLTVTGNATIQGSISGTITGSATSASYAQTASSIANLNQNVQITGSLTTNGTITAQTLVVQTVTSSIVYSSGSNIFGNSSANTQKFTGSVLISGSSTFSNNITLTGGYIETPWANETRTVWERYSSATYFQRISSNGAARQLRIESNGAYGNASIVLDGQSNDTTTATITSDKFVATGPATFSSNISTPYIAINSAMTLSAQVLGSVTTSWVSTNLTTLYVGFVFIYWADSDSGERNTAVVTCNYYPSGVTVISSSNNGGKGMQFQMNGSTLQLKTTTGTAAGVQLVWFKV